MVLFMGIVLYTAIIVLLVVILYFLLRMRSTILVEKNSPLVGKIVVIQKANGERLLTTGGFSQGVSVGNVDLADSYWYYQAEKILSHCNGKKNPSVLWLGLGAGTGPHLVARKNKKISQTAIEFDPLIIKTAEEYFSLTLIPNLTIIPSDAYKEINTLKKIHKRFDAISVDIYINDDPQNGKRLTKEHFLQTAFQLLTPGGIILFNRLAHKEDERKRTEEFINDLREKHKAVTSKFIRDSRGYRNDIVVVST